jgi:glycine cleavage system aminomethyltransferase T
MIILHIQVFSKLFSHIWTSFCNYNDFHQVVGNTTSGLYSPALGCNLAFAYLPNMVANTSGSHVQVEVLGKLRGAEVLTSPPMLTYPVREKNKKSQGIKAEEVASA